MNKYYYDAVLRMSVEMALFMVPGGTTISRISEGLQLDRSLIREDVLNLFTFDEMRELLHIEFDENEDNEDLNDDVYFEKIEAEEKLDSYKYCYYELINMHYDIKNIDEKGFSRSAFEVLYDDIPMDFDPDQSWKKEALNLIDVLNKKIKEIKTEKTEAIKKITKNKKINKKEIQKEILDEIKKGIKDNEQKALLKCIDNAKIRMYRRIQGTTEEGAKKGISRMGERYGILSGLYDDTVFLLEEKYLGYKGDLDEFMLPLSGEEYTHLKSFLDKQDTPLEKMDGLFKVKNSLEIQNNETEVKYEILDRIKDKKGIKFEYTNKKTGGTDWVKILPKWINYNSDTGFMYIIDSDDYKYKVDRIKNLRIYDLEAGEKPDKKEKLKKEYVEVVIYIPKVEGYDNLINKIKGDVGRRNMDPDYNVEEHFTEEEGMHIYKDKIEKGDIGSFKSWIYSYGSSMIVISPPDLRQQVINSYKVRADYY